jgi:hypothetical protein
MFTGAATIKLHTLYTSASNSGEWSLSYATLAEQLQVPTALHADCISW